MIPHTQLALLTWERRHRGLGRDALLFARATFAAAGQVAITLRNGARIIEKTWPADN